MRKARREKASPRGKRAAARAFSENPALFSRRRARMSRDSMARGTSRWSQPLPDRVAQRYKAARQRSRPKAAGLFLERRGTKNTSRHEKNLDRSRYFPGVTY